MADFLAIVLSDFNLFLPFDEVALLELEILDKDRISLKDC
tara:strand:- start:999 stop:1118 length:120 start_codon:yes stop_codon:yes gene_type:complete